MQTIFFLPTMNKFLSFLFQPLISNYTVVLNNLEQKLEKTSKEIFFNQGKTCKEVILSPPLIIWILE